MLTVSWLGKYCLCILSQVPDSQNNNNYVAWKKLLLTISLGTASIIQLYGNPYSSHGWGLFT